MNKWLSLLLPLSLLLVLPALGRSRRNVIADLDNFPNPTKDFEQCGRKQESFICDPELYIRPKTSDYLDQLAMNATKSDLVWCPRSSDNNEKERYSTINGIDRSNFELRGLQIGIALISSFKSYDHNVPVTASYNDYDYLASKYSKSIHDQWGIGDSDCNNGIMIFISIDDRVLYISTGSGIKNIITDNFIDSYLMNKIRPKMRRELYDEAIITMLDIIFEMLFYQDDQENSEIYKEWNSMKDSSDDSSPLFSFFGIFDVSWEDCFITTLVVGFISYIYYQSKRNAEYRECQNRLASIYAQSQQRRFNQQSCPICLEDFDSDTNNVPNRPTSLLPCGHKFCTQCLDEWFGGRIRTNHRCPVCRQHRDDLTNVPNDENIANNPPDSNNNNNNNNNNNDNDNTGTNTGINPNNTDNSNNIDRNNNNNQNDENESKEDINPNRDDRNDYRRDRSDFTQDFPNVDKNRDNTQSSTSSSTFYGARTGPQGRNERERDNEYYERQREREREEEARHDRQNNRFFRNYMRYNMMNDMMYRNDLNFRLRRMRHFYPRYIDDNMVNRWSNPNYNGGSFTNDSTFRANNPTPPQSHSGNSRQSSWGSRGSGRSYRFGGGSSFGGGGGGGRW